MEAIIAIIVGVVAILTSVFVAAWKLSKAIEDRPTYDHVENNYMRKDLHKSQYDNLVEKIDKLIKVVDQLVVDVGKLMK